MDTEETNTKFINVDFPYKNVGNLKSKDVYSN